MSGKKGTSGSKLVLPRPAWATLLVLDTALFVSGCLTANLPALVVACGVAYLIERFGHQELFGQVGQGQVGQGQVGQGHGARGQGPRLTRRQIHDVTLELRKQKRGRRR